MSDDIEMLDVPQPPSDPPSDPYRFELWGSDFDSTNTRPGAASQGTARPTAAYDTGTEMTFGVEIEYLQFFRVCFPWENPDSSQLSEKYPGIILISADEADPDLQALNKSVQTLRANGVDINNYNAGETRVEAPSGAPSLTPYSENCNQSMYHRWTLRWDTSVDLVTGVDDHLRSSGRLSGARTGVMPMELITPAMKLNEESLTEIDRVVNLVNATFAVHLNKTAGLHVHVGMGKTRFPPMALKNIASVLWIADSILSPLHPDHRQNNSYCRRNRTDSRLANGMTATDATVAGRSWTTCADMSLQEGFDEIRKCQTSEQVARLIRCRDPTDSSAYNFDHYIPFVEIDPSSDDSTPSRPTIEFRQGAGSLNPAWICHMAYIYTKICEWAVKNYDSEYINCDLIVRCDSIEAGEAGYEELLDKFLRHVSCENSAEYVKATNHDQRAGMKLPTTPPVSPSPDSHQDPSPPRQIDGQSTTPTGSPPTAEGSAIVAGGLISPQDPRYLTPSNTYREPGSSPPNPGLGPTSSPWS